MARETFTTVVFCRVDCRNSPVEEAGFVDPRPLDGRA